LRRAATRAYDTEATVWLDPQRSHRPVRLQITVRSTDEAMEFVLAAPAR
jgi:hypothetical protein